MDIWFEAVPSPGGASEARIQRDARRLQTVHEAGATRILVPEVVDTGFEGVDAIRFAADVAAFAQTPVGVAVVTAGRTVDEVSERMALADRYGVDTLLVVGPASGDATQAGPSVTETLEAHAGKRNLGVVTIPTRRRDDLDEPERVLGKQRAGARFAVSQILFEAETALALRRDYIRRLAPGEAPIPFYYSLAPVRKAKDLQFLTSLGVYIPDDVATAIEEASDPNHAAQAATVRVAQALLQAHADEDLGPIGFCISHVLHPNVDVAISLLEAVHGLQVPA